MNNQEVVSPNLEKKSHVWLYIVISVFLFIIIIAIIFIPKFIVNKTTKSLLEDGKTSIESISNCINVDINGKFQNGCTKNDCSLILSRTDTNSYVQTEDLIVTLIDNSGKENILEYNENISPFGQINLDLTNNPNFFENINEVSKANMKLSFDGNPCSNYISIL